MSDPQSPDNSQQRKALSYLLPVEDTDFLSNREELRGLRFALDRSTSSDPPTCLRFCRVTV